MCSMRRSMNAEREMNGEVVHDGCSSVREPVGPHSAMQIALQTMNERCEQLQQRLSAVEEENLCLRLEKSRSLTSDQEKPDDCDDVNTSEENCQSKSLVEKLQHKVAKLKRQKSQLTHHLFILANENKQLWSRLSHLTEANNSLGNHLSKISSTLSRHSSAGSSAQLKTEAYGPAQDASRSNSPASGTRSCRGSADFPDKELDAIPLTYLKPATAASEDMKDESMEEISLKLIKSFLQEKTELEEQCAQMMEIQSGASSFSIATLGFGFLDASDDDCLVAEVQQHCDKLRSVRDALQEQQRGLRAVAGHMERICDGGKRSSHLIQWCHPKRSALPEDVQQELSQVAEPPALAAVTALAYDPRNDDRMCPLCGKLYHHSASFEEFTQHVSDHFVDEEGPLSDTFELIS